MPLPYFVKTGPFIAGVGTVGVGTAGIVAYSTLGGGKGNANVEEDQPRAEEVAQSSVSTPQIDAALKNAIRSPNESLMKNLDLKTIYDDTTSQWDNEASLNNEIFQIPGNSGCFSSFFPKVKTPDYHDSIYFKKNRETVHYTDNKNSLKISNPSEEGSGKAEACAMMSFHYYQLYTLFKSELVMKNDKVGIAVWTGFKTVNDNSTWKDYLQLHITHYMMFLEKDGDEWKVKGGYSWSDQKGENKIHTSKLIVQSPDSTSVNTTLEKAKEDGTYATEAGVSSYSGVWNEVEDGRGTSLLQLKGEEYGKNTESTPMESLDFSLPLPMAGYNKVGVFYEKNGQDKWEWKRYCKTSGSCQGKDKQSQNLDVDVSDSITKWYAPFQNKKGTWTKVV